MDLKELITKINEGLTEDINNPYTVQELNSDAKYIIGVLNKNLELLSKEDEDFDRITMNMLGAAEDLVAFLQDFRKDMEELKDANFEESVNEAISDTDDMLNRIDIPNKTILTDLGFTIRVQEVNGGVAFGANLTTNQFKPYRPSDHKASKEEIIDVVDRCGDILTDALDKAEDEIMGIFNERGFRA